MTPPEGQDKNEESPRFRRGTMSRLFMTTGLTVVTWFVVFFVLDIIHPQLPYTLTIPLLVLPFVLWPLFFHRFLWHTSIKQGAEMNRPDVQAEMSQEQSATVNREMETGKILSITKTPPKTPGEKRAWEPGNMAYVARLALFPYWFFSLFVSGFAFQGLPDSQFIPIWAGTIIINSFFVKMVYNWIVHR